MTKVFTILLFLIPSIAYSAVEGTTTILDEGTTGILSLSYGTDTIHDKGRERVELRYIDKETTLFTWNNRILPIGWSAYADSDRAIGGDLFWFYRNWEVGLGVEYGEVEDDIVETEWKYGFRVDYLLSENWTIQFLHKSNCRDLCSKTGLDNILPHGPKDKSNKGLNYLGLSYRF